MTVHGFLKLYRIVDIVYEGLHCKTYCLVHHYLRILTLLSMNVNNDSVLECVLRAQNGCKLLG
jgi:hypothetical protein